MKKGLLIVERIVVESLSKKEKNISEIEIDTRLTHDLLLNILSGLILQGIIRYKGGIYSLAKENSFLWLKQINERNVLKEEVKELFTSLVNQYFKSDFAKSEQIKLDQLTQLKIQKMWLTPDEEMVLKSHMATLDGFFQGIKDARKKSPEKEKICEQRVVIWGVSTYADLIDGTLKAI